jgi:5-methylthioribose kinase
MTSDFCVPANYRILSLADLPQIAAEIPVVATALGGSPDRWRVTEVSDGNMNAVWRIDGPAGSVIAKQALPYIRVIGESWPFPVSRIAFEAAAMAQQAAHVGRYLPQLYDYQADLGLIFMQALTPHRVLRLGLVDGVIYPQLADHLGDYLARSLYFTSDLHLGTEAKADLTAHFTGNAHLCATSQDVIFTGPYHDAPLNRLTPGQEKLAATLRADPALKLAAAEMKHIFATKAEALIHGDLHTGSVMVTADDTRIIDPEWAFVGPMGFDIGAIIGNLLLAYFGQSGLGPDRAAQEKALLTCIKGLWDSFATGFASLAQTETHDFLHPAMLDTDLRGRFVQTRINAIFADTLGFAGAKMIRRIIGISHVADFECISDIPTRATCEARALHLARALLLDRHQIGDIGMVIARAQAIRQG